MNIIGCQSQIFRNLNNNLGIKSQYNPIFRGGDVEEDTFQLAEKSTEDKSQKPGTRIFKNSDGEVLKNVQLENGLLKTENGDLFTGTIKKVELEGIVYDGYKDGELIARLDGDSATYYDHTMVPHNSGIPTKRTDVYCYDLNTGKLVEKKTLKYDESGKLIDKETSSNSTLSTINSVSKYTNAGKYFDTIKNIFNLG